MAAGTAAYHPAARRPARAGHRLRAAARPRAGARHGRAHRRRRVHSLGQRRGLVHHRHRQHRARAAPRAGGLQRRRDALAQLFAGAPLPADAAEPPRLRGGFRGHPRGRAARRRPGPLRRGGDLVHRLCAGGPRGAPGALAAGAAGRANALARAGRLWFSTHAVAVGTAGYPARAGQRAATHRAHQPAARFRGRPRAARRPPLCLERPASAFGWCAAAGRATQRTRPGVPWRRAHALGRLPGQPLRDCRGARHRVLALGGRSLHAAAAQPGPARAARARRDHRERAPHAVRPRGRRRFRLARRTGRQPAGRRRDAARDH